MIRSKSRNVVLRCPEKYINLNPTCSVLLGGATSYLPADVGAHIFSKDITTCLQQKLEIVTKRSAGVLVAVKSHPKSATETYP